MKTPRQRDPQTQIWPAPWPRWVLVQVCEKSCSLSMLARRLAPVWSQVHRSLPLVGQWPTTATFTVNFYSHKQSHKPWQHFRARSPLLSGRPYSHCSAFQDAPLQVFWPSFLFCHQLASLTAPTMEKEGGVKVASMKQLVEKGKINSFICR